MSRIKRITSERANEIVTRFEPLGLFIVVDGFGYVGIDNTTGDAWTEEFKSKCRCIKWLLGGSNEDREQEETLAVIDDEVKRLKTTIEILEDCRTGDLKDIAELEEFCENVCEVQKKQVKKIKNLENETEELSNERYRLNATNESLYKQIEILKVDFNLKQVTCNLLKTESENAKENTKTWSKRYNQVNEINVKLLEELREQKVLNKDWQIACNKLRERNEIQEEINKNDGGRITAIVWGGKYK